MTLIDFDATAEDAALIEQIVDRHEALFQRLFPAQPFDRLSASMDLTATHLNGCPLRLKDLLEADDFNFAHDVGGIARHIDRSTGQLTRCFLPRFFDSEAAK